MLVYALKLARLVRLRWLLDKVILEEQPLSLVIVGTLRRLPEAAARMIFLQFL
jgi:hypothetical protein